MNLALKQLKKISDELENGSVLDEPNAQKLINKLTEKELLELLDYCLKKEV